ncbi:MAG TPA: endonuclease [Acetobacteraceae bacterium]|jgi:sugar phosphate isomerase/epimerase|nr:endonuclease [Acetobacteraceae bacterium]
MIRFSLAHLTALSLTPPELIRVAAGAGYASVGLRLIQVTPETPGYPLMTDKAMLRETRAAMSDTGVTVNDIEFIRITPEIDIQALEPFFATGAELGARWAVAAPYDADPTRLADRFAALCDLAARYDQGVVLEFFPWTEINGVASANTVVQAAGRANGGILVDTLHFDRCGDVPADLDAIPPARMPFVHVCDAPAERPTTLEGLLHHARAERLPPGEGGIEIKSVLAHMPAGIPVALEVPMTALTRSEGPEAVIRRAIDAARRLLGA